ncbi:MAG: GNAT family N-acetyltransferase [Robiginitomaculum sp.]|nr:MAG: GNAT family N-acetyltransferase [Robiginitomaculum sp.]
MKFPPPTLTTERLILRALQTSDAADLHVAFSDAKVCKYWSHAAHTSLAQSQNRVDENIAWAESLTWAITKGEGQPALGWVILFPGRNDGIAELGYILRRSAWGQGLVGEAAMAVVNYGFEVEGMRRIFADMDPDNIGSIRIAEKCGMTYEGRLKANWDTHIGVRDSLIYGRVELAD